MPLLQVVPFTCDEYLNRLDPFVEQIVDALLNHEQQGWLCVLDRYEFGDMGRIEGEQIRTDLHRRLRSADNQEARLNICNEILAWGGMQPIEGELANSVLNALDVLDDENELALIGIESRRIASISKIYEMWDPESWIIYDSYCAIGFQWLISAAWTGLGRNQHEEILRLPWPPGRSNQRLPGFPVLGSSRQAALGFIYSSFLARGISHLLNERGQDDFVWQPYHVEMVAFQLGHEVGV